MKKTLQYCLLIICEVVLTSYLLFILCVCVCILALLYAAVEEMEEKIFRAKFKKFDPEGDTAADMNISALQLEPFLEELGTCSPCKR